MPVCSIQVCVCVGAIWGYIGYTGQATSWFITTEQKRKSKTGRGRGEEPNREEQKEEKVYNVSWIKL